MRRYHAYSYEDDDSGDWVRFSDLPKWQTMDSAPDNENLLLVFGGGYIGTGKKAAGIRNGATHWMLPPKLPEK